MERRLLLCAIDVVLLIPTIGVVALGLIPHQWLANTPRRVFLAYYGWTALVRASTLYVDVHTRARAHRVCSRAALLVQPYIARPDLGAVAPLVALEAFRAFAAFGAFGVRMQPKLWLSMYVIAVAHVAPVWYVACALCLQAAACVASSSEALRAVAIALADTSIALHVTYANSKPLPRLG